MQTIDLDQIAGSGGVGNLSGKDRGEAARRHFDLDRLEQDAPVVVKVPDYLYAISPSFFLGLFSPSVKRAGTADRFFENYKFIASAPIMRQVVRGIDRCLAHKPETEH